MGKLLTSLLLAGTMTFGASCYSLLPHVELDVKTMNIQDEGLIFSYDTLNACRWVDKESVIVKEDFRSFWVVADYNCDNKIEGLDQLTLMKIEQPKTGEGKISYGKLLVIRGKELDKGFLLVGSGTVGELEKRMKSAWDKHNLDKETKEWAETHSYTEKLRKSNEKYAKEHNLKLVPCKNWEKGKCYDAILKKCHDERLESKK